MSTRRTSPISVTTLLSVLGLNVLTGCADYKEQSQFCARDFVCPEGSSCTEDGSGCIKPKTRCGDGIVDKDLGERCDDGNVKNAVDYKSSEEGHKDSCSSDCMSDYSCGNGLLDGPRFDGDLPKNYYELHDGDPRIEVCDEGRETRTCNLNPRIKDGVRLPTDCKGAICGDGYQNTAAREACDDGNITPGDGCNADCSSDESCGNGIIDRFVGEICDDGASNGESGKCRKDCRSSGLCGNGQLDPAFEQCDYCVGLIDPATGTLGVAGATGTGSENAGGAAGSLSTAMGVGGASHKTPDCPISESKSCNHDCTFAQCGDGKINRAAGEECDEHGGTDTADCNGNTAPPSAACRKAKPGDGYANAAAGEACDSTSDSPTCNRSNALPAEAACRESLCGDGYVNTAAGELCDHPEDSSTCNGSGAPASVACRVALCGDGYVNAAAGESCDSVVDSERCNRSGFDLPATAACRQATCGDGYTNMAAGEACDTIIDTETCNKSSAPDGAGCHAAKCGDGYINRAAGELCDEATDTSNCNRNGKDVPVSAACRKAQCGDGYTNTEAGEVCDREDDASDCNSNTASPSEAACKTPRCGDGYVNELAGENCDSTIDSSNCNRSGAPGAAACHTVICGDGYVNTVAGEQCDPGKQSLQGCDAECHILPGYDSCTSTACTPTCGDGLLVPGEACDNNKNSGTSCGFCDVNCSPVPNQPARATGTITAVTNVGQHCSIDLNGKSYSCHCYRDGDTITISDGVNAVVFEVKRTKAHMVESGHQTVNAVTEGDPEVMAARIAALIQTSGLAVNVSTQGQVVTVTSNAEGFLKQFRIEAAMKVAYQAGFGVAVHSQGSGYDCPNGKSCASSNDCRSRVCHEGVCLAPTCSDSVKNDAETAVDCGGSCTPCPNGSNCLIASDCTSGVCAQGTCKEPVPTCDDEVPNGTETDVDCGGECPRKCKQTQKCKVTVDCDNVLCDEGTCQAPACNDLLPNGDETDVDCGGEGECPKCKPTGRCERPTDCDTGQCSNNACQHACGDEKMNGFETDVDCGGQCPERCKPTQKCNVTSDCDNVLCNVTCQQPACNDELRNGTETDIDCGNAECGACLGQPCGPSMKCATGTTCVTSGDAGPGTCQ